MAAVLHENLGSPRHPPRRRAKWRDAAWRRYIRRCHGTTGATPAGLHGMPTYQPFYRVVADVNPRRRFDRLAKNVVSVERIAIIKCGMHVPSRSGNFELFGAPWTKLAGPNQLRCHYVSIM